VFMRACTPCTGTFTLFATHFGRLTELAGLYPNAKLWHFGVDTARDRLDFTWRYVTALLTTLWLVRSMHLQRCVNITLCSFHSHTALRCFLVI